MFSRCLTFIVAALALGISASATLGAYAAAPSAASPLVGSWTVEQVPPGGAQHSEGTMIFTQSGNDLSGVLRVGRTQLPLSDIDDTGGIVSFTVVIPRNITLHYVAPLWAMSLACQRGRGQRLIHVNGSPRCRHRCTTSAGGWSDSCSSTRWSTSTRRRRSPSRAAACRRLYRALAQPESRTGCSRLTAGDDRPTAAATTTRRQRVSNRASADGSALGARTSSRTELGGKLECPTNPSRFSNAERGDPDFHPKWKPACRHDAVGWRTNAPVRCNPGRAQRVLHVGRSRNALHHRALQGHARRQPFAINEPR